MDVTVVTNPTVNVRLTSTISSFEVQRRFNRGISIAELKGKLEMVIGAASSGMDLELFSVSDKFLQKMDDNEALLGSYAVDDDCRIHVTDTSGQMNEFTDVSKVEKFELSDDAYEKRTDSARSFMKKNRFDLAREEEIAKKKAANAAREEENKAAADAMSVGNRCQVQVPGQPTKVGTVMFVGTTDFKPGYWVGVKYDEPMGKHDGTVDGKKYFECVNKYGAFVKPTTVNSNGTAATTDGQVVPTPENALDPQQQQPPPQPAPNAWQVIKGVLFRIFIIWAISSWFRRGPSTPDPNTPAGAPRVPSRNLFPKDTLMDLYVYISQEEVFTDFNNTESLFWFHRDLVYGDWTIGEEGDGCYEQYKEMDIPEEVQKNGSLYMHVYFTKSGFHPDPKRKGQYRRLATVHSSRMLNKFKRRKFMKTKNLLTGETEADPEVIKRAESHGPVEVISHWHPNLTINMVDDHTAWVKGSVPPPLDQHVKFDAVSGDYYPIVYFNDYWNLQKDYYPINDSLKALPLRLSYCPLSLWRWQLYAAQNARSPWNFLPEDTYEQSDEDQDSVKVALLETNPYLLGLTIVVSIVHSIFEFLAFKNDIQFWNSRQSLEGLSVRSITFGVFQSLVVLLYILDNETNFVVQVSVFIGLLIDLWKITKVMDVKLDRENKILGVVPRLVFKDKSTYVKSSTKIYDDMAFKYLSWLLYPLFGCYAIYSLLYVEHKGWYSWVLSMLYGFLLTFGFITMTPQLFINYKMKSVAHLPWRMLTYKALNTFIDDLFAFVIKMPMMYRIGCLRDDVVFFVYLYQRWIYRVDPNRVNEFGTSGVEPTSDTTAEGDAAPDAPATPAAITDKPEGEKKND